MIDLKVFYLMLFSEINILYSILIFYFQCVSSASGTESDAEVEEEKKVKKSNFQVPKTRNNKMKSKDTEYFVTPDNYFMMNSSKKVNIYRDLLYDILLR